MSTGKEQFEREFEAFLAEEEHRVAALYRKLPQPEPDARLDAAVRAMAHRALNPQLVATPRAAPARRRAARWLPAFGAAAGIVLAAGVAYRLGVPEGRQNEYSRPASQVIEVRPIDAPAPASQPPLSPPPPGESAAKAVPSPNAKPRSAGKVQATATPALAEPQKPAAPDDATATAGGGVPAASSDEKTAVAPQAFPEQDKSLGNGVNAAEALDSRQTRGTRQNLHEREQGEHRKKEQAQLQDRLGFGEHVAKQRRARRDDDTAAAPTAAAATPSPAMAPPATVAPSAPAAASEAARTARSARPQVETTRAADATATPSAAESKDAAHRAAPSPPAPATAASVPPRLREEAPSSRASPAAAGTAQRAIAPTPARVAEPAQGRADSGFARDAREQKVPASNDPNARLYPEHWLDNIRTMLREGRRGEALHSLGDFRRLYPDYALPDDLRDLQ